MYNINNCRFSHIFTLHQTPFFVALLIGGCLFVLCNIPRRSDALNFFLLASVAQGHLVLEVENKFHLATKQQLCVRRGFALHLETSSGTSESIFTNTTIWQGKWLPAPPPTHTHNNCFVQTWKDIKPPSGLLICSQLAFPQFIYNWKKNEAFLWLLILVAISSLSDAQLLTPERNGWKIAKKKKKEKKGSDLLLSVEVQLIW